MEKKAINLTTESLNIVLNDNELLRIRMGHSDKKYVITIFPDYQFYTYKTEVKEKKNIFTIIGGIILTKEDNSGSFQDALKMFTEKVLELRTKTNEEITAFIRENEKQYFHRPQIILDKKELEKRLSDKIKELNKAGKFDQANTLLDRIKKVPTKLYEAHEAGEIAVKRGEYEKAEKEYENARKFAEELEEKELVQMYKEKINLTKKIPTLLKKREEFLTKAMEGMRTDNFTQAQKAFKQAADVSEELLDSRHAEEYALKAKALAEYVKVESKFKN